MKKVATLEKYTFKSYREIKKLYESGESMLFMGTYYDDNDKALSLYTKKELNDLEGIPEEKSRTGLYYSIETCGITNYYPIEDYELNDIYGLKEVNL